jgi:spore maturation protein CgeB
MRVALFTHSLLSDWNHGSAHFLRGIASELAERGHEVLAYEPRDAWSYRNLIADQGAAPLERLHTIYPRLTVVRYDGQRLALDEILRAADLVLVHEWNDPELVRRIGAYRERGGYRLLFHDTHHRSVSDPAALAACDLSEYDGVLACGRAIGDLYLERGWARRAWVWHQAADVRVFRPLPELERTGDLVWIGNWGDGERTAGLHEYLIDSAAALGLSATVYGVRYPAAAQRALQLSGIEYRGWLPNYDVPSVFARFRVTVHVPRGYYARELPGIPTIRPFEALACGIPLVSAPWHDAERLFTPGRDFLFADGAAEMQSALRRLIDDPAHAAALAEHGLGTIAARHTCAHRVDELLAIARELGLTTTARPAPPVAAAQGG